MAKRTQIQTAFDDFAKSLGMEKVRTSWYRRGNGVTSALHLQKSNYGPRYFVHIGFEVQSIGTETYPEAHRCHVSTRLELVAPARKAEADRLLDLEVNIEGDRSSKLIALLHEALEPVLDAASTPDGLAALLESSPQSALVHPAARSVLQRPRS